MDEEGLRVSAAFQKFLVDELGFAPKAYLIGMSWGGFFSVRYTVNYPGNVAKIYLDAPLLDLGGRGDITESRVGPWAKIGLKDEDFHGDPRMPVNMAGQIAAAKIPVLLIYGGADAVVPPKINCEAFAERFKAAGGKISVIRRAAFGHHPHGLDPDKTQPIIDFFRKADGD
jgi:pimeloyl-ACP methyl ester carboxylesterase